MDGFQFIIESPQHNEGHKKRPRLVTSCDNCRLKKIKCLQSGPSSSANKCEACKVAKIPCRFRDRERYFAERSRAIAGPTAGSGESDRSSSRGSTRSERGSSRTSPPFDSSRPSSSYSLRSNGRSPSHSPRTSGIQGIDGDSSRYQPYSTDHRRKTDSYSSSSSGYSYNSPRLEPSGYLVDSRSSNFLRSPTDVLSIENPQNLPPVPLFDPDNLQRPHPRLMPHFIQTLDLYRTSNQCPFIGLEETMSQFFEGRLTPLISNSIAALAVRFSDLPEITARGSHNVAETYANTAKNILSSVMHIPALDTLHAFMLIGWSDYKSSRVPEFRAYVQLAMRMAADLGLSDENILLLNPNEREQQRLRITWTSLVQLSYFATSLDA